MTRTTYILLLLAICLLAGNTLGMHALAEAAIALFFWGIVVYVAARTALKIRRH